jgi:hypothetical protein
MPGLHPHWSVSLFVRELQPVRVSRPVHRGFAVCEAALRVARAWRPHVSRRADRETVHEPWRMRSAVPVADSARRECQYARGPVRLRPLAVTQCGDPHGASAESRRRRVQGIGVRGVRHRGLTSALTSGLTRIPRGARVDDVARVNPHFLDGRAAPRGASVRQDGARGRPGPPWRASRRQNILRCEVARHYASPGTGMDTVHLGNVG